MSLVTQGLGGNETSLLLQGFGYSGVIFEIIGPSPPPQPPEKLELIICPCCHRDIASDYHIIKSPLGYKQAFCDLCGCEVPIPKTINGETTYLSYDIW